jgi:glycine reductase
VGAPRIVPTRGIPFPTGDPELVPEEERRLRRGLLERALEALGTAVEGPTVFAAPDMSDNEARPPRTQAPVS